MINKKLSPTQIDVIRKMREGERLYHSLGLAGGYYMADRGFSYKVSSNTIQAIYNKGLIKDGGEETHTKQEIILTQLGEQINIEPCP